MRPLHQMDIKVEGITIDIMRAALTQARQGRLHILGEMAKCAPPPRRQLSDYAPRIVSTVVEISKIGSIIGPGGRTLREILEKSGARGSALTWHLKHAPRHKC